MHHPHTSSSRLREHQIPSEEITSLKMRLCAALLAVVGLTSVAWCDQTKTDVVERLQSATKTLHQILNTPDKGIPDEVFKGAKCIAVVPGLIKGGFIIAGKHGRGVAT